MVAPVGGGLIVEPFGSFWNAIVRPSVTNVAAQLVLLVVISFLLASQINPFFFETLVGAFACFALRADTFAEWPYDRMARNESGDSKRGEDHQACVPTKDVMIWEYTGDRLSVVEKDGGASISQKERR